MPPLPSGLPLGTSPIGYADRGGKGIVGKKAVSELTNVQIVIFDTADFYSGVS